MNRARWVATLTVVASVGCAFEIHFDEPRVTGAGDADAGLDSELGGAAHDAGREAGAPATLPDPVGPPDALPPDVRPDVQPPADVWPLDGRPPGDGKSGG